MDTVRSKTIGLAIASVILALATIPAVTAHEAFASEPETPMVLTTQDTESFTIGETLEGTVSDEGGTVSYSMIVPQTGLVSFSLEFPSSGSIKYQIKSNTYSDGDDYRSGGTYTFSQYLRAGTYTMSFTEGIWNGMGDTTHFTLNSHVDPVTETHPETMNHSNDSKETAFAISANTSIHAVLDLPDEKDIYKFDISKDCRYRVTVDDIHFGGASRTVDLKLYDGFSEVDYSEDKIKGGSVYDFNLKKGTYYLEIDPRGQEEYVIATSTSALPKSEIKTFKNKKGKRAVVKWSRKESCSGYQVQIAKDKKFTKGKRTFRISDYRAKSQAIDKLSKKKTYYARVRAAYNTSSDSYKAYSEWSTIKKVKIKK